MSRSKILSSLILSTLVATLTPLNAQRAGDADAVKALELERFQAQEKNDFAALDRLLGDDLVYSHSSGAVDSKASYIESLKTGKTKYLRIVSEEIKPRVIGDVILLHGRAAVTLETNTNGQKGENKLNLSYLDVWQKRNGKWQMIAWQSTRLP